MTELIGRQGGRVLVLGSDGTSVQPLSVDTSGRLTEAPSSVFYVNRSIENLSGASQVLMSGNLNRKILIIHNPSANSVAVNLVGGAAAMDTAGCIEIPAGGSLIMDRHPPTNTITVIGTLNDDLTAFEG